MNRDDEEEEVKHVEEVEEEVEEKEEEEGIERCPLCLKLLASNDPSFINSHIGKYDVYKEKGQTILLSVALHESFCFLPQLKYTYRPLPPS